MERNDPRFFPVHAGKWSQSTNHINPNLSSWPQEDLPKWSQRTAQLVKWRRWEANSSRFYGLEKGLGSLICSSKTPAPWIPLVWLFSCLLTSFKCLSRSAIFFPRLPPPYQTPRFLWSMMPTSYSRSPRPRTKSFHPMQDISLHKTNLFPLDWRTKFLWQNSHSYGLTRDSDFLSLKKNARIVEKTLDALQKSWLFLGSHFNTISYSWILEWLRNPPGAMMLVPGSRLVKGRALK